MYNSEQQKGPSYLLVKLHVMSLINKHKCGTYSVIVLVS